jgi:hypothetical protein
MTIKGHGFAWFETGTEGTRWCLIDETGDPHSYSSLYELNPGDSLTVYDKEDPTSIIWTGTVKYETNRRRRAHPFNSAYSQQEVFGYWITYGFQEDLDPETWARYFFDEYPMQVVQQSSHVVSSQ